MQNRFRKVLMICTAALPLLLLAALGHCQDEAKAPDSPPISQDLAREGDLALALLSSLGLGDAENETEAESRLGELGIAPRNGWIADYPVTPDIIGELRQSLSTAVDAGKIKLSREEALQKLEESMADFGIAVKPHTVETVYESEEPLNYPNPTVINNYYYEEGPPVVTYYAPPSDFYNLYAWVPYPFWSFGVSFPGYFILNDFHRTVFIGNRVRFVSNHFNDFRVNRVFRIDPRARFRGRTYAGIGVSGNRGFIATGVPRSAERIFNGPRSRPNSGGRAYSGPSRPGRGASPAYRGGRSYSPPAGRGRSPSAAPRGGGAPAGRPVRR